MSESHRKNLKNLELRTRLPRIIRAVAVFALILALLVLVIGFYRARTTKEFRMKGFPTTLSKDVVAEINDYERTETEGDLRKYYIKASKATTYSDNHQELENVYFEVFDETGLLADKINAGKGIYVPGENKNFTAYLAGQVSIETRDALKIRTEQITYKKESETAEAEELVEFERENISGKSVGAFVNIREKRLELKTQVEIDAFALDPADKLAKSNVKSARITSNYAMVDQLAEKIELSDNVFIGIIPYGANSEMSQPTDITAARASVGFVEREVRTIEFSGGVNIHQKPTAANAKWSKTKAEKAFAAVDRELKRVELTDNVEIESASGDAQPTKINCGHAVYEKDADRFDLREAVHIVTVQDGRLTNIRSSEAIYEQSNGRIALTGGAEIDNGRELVRGDRVNAELFPNRAVKSANSKGSAYLRQTTPERTTEVSADELNAFFGEDSQLRSANAVGGSTAVLVPTNSREYSRVTLTAPRAIRLGFKNAGLLDQLSTEGRTTIVMKAPDGAPDAADKTLTADVVKTFFNQNGKDIRLAEAVGNAELLVDPLSATEENYRTTVKAPRFDCEFFPTGNNARICVAQTKTQTVRVPTVKRDGRGVQTLTADKLTTTFDSKTQDVEQFEAIGSAKFVELERNGIASQMTFAAREKLVRLRGGEPTVWDSQARAKANEIDWDTRNQRSFLRGNVATTYYNQKQTGGATPFSQSNKPVFLTSANAEFDHTAETGLYTGNARAWQENNFIRAEKIFVRQKEGQLFADGAVQSLLYDAKTSDRKSVPVYASSQKMTFSRETRILRYEDSVDIRQGSDRATAGIATILLNEKNEMSQTTLEKNVIITQPKRRATGTWAQYTNDSEVAILRGDPATVEDAESGSTQGAQLTVNSRENRVVNEAKTSPNSTGRIRSVYKVKKN
ncbi:MAG: LPS export ABC transporter periplasmic protein LptC [Acidobacteria bacterium]|nr:LPS export ABC transporter periplasmic protein LptC [Acidobacteriota bacterium]